MNTIRLALLRREGLRDTYIQVLLQLYFDERVSITPFVSEHRTLLQTFSDMPAQDFDVVVVIDRIHDEKNTNEQIRDLWGQMFSNPFTQLIVINDRGDILSLDTVEFVHTRKHLHAALYDVLETSQYKSLWADYKADSEAAETLKNDLNNYRSGYENYTVLTDLVYGLYSSFGETLPSMFNQTLFETFADNVDVVKAQAMIRKDYVHKKAQTAMHHAIQVGDTVYAVSDAQVHTTPVANLINQYQKESQLKTVVIFLSEVWNERMMVHIQGFKGADLEFLKGKIGNNYAAYKDTLLLYFMSPTTCKLFRQTLLELLIEGRS